MRQFVTVLLAGQVIADQVSLKDAHKGSVNDTSRVQGNAEELRQSLGLTYDGVLNNQVHEEPLVVKGKKADVVKVKLGDLRDRLLTKNLTPDEQEFVNSLRDNYLVTGRARRVGAPITEQQDQDLDLFSKLLGATTYTQPLYRNAKGEIYLGEKEKVAEENHDNELIEIRVNSKDSSKSEDRSR